jgi:hypothetical protein
MGRLYRRKQTRPEERMLLKALDDMVAAMYARKSIDQTGVADE